MNKNILICCALAHEMNIVKQNIKNLDMKGLNIKFLLTGVGNYNVIFSLKDYINKNGRPDFLVNIGVCGVLSQDFQVQDFLQAYRVKNAANNRESLLPIYIKQHKLISLLSTEKTITDKNEMCGEGYVDMESYAIDFIATKEKIPYIILKKTFDIVGKGSKNVSIDELKDSLQNYNYQNLLKNIGKYLCESKQQEENLEVYKSHFSLTFSEFEQFKKARNRMIAFGKKFEDFFEENKELSKKEFLEKMNN